MSAEKRQLYSSPNGDRWFLARDPATDNVFIRHESNLPSGGSVTEIDIGDFLSSGPRNPEHQALLQLIGTLVEDGPLPHAVNKILAQRGLSSSGTWSGGPSSFSGGCRSIVLGLSD